MESRTKHGERRRLNAKKVIVTDATKDIGRAVAEKLPALGAETLIVARSQSEVSKNLFKT